MEAVIPLLCLFLKRIYDAIRDRIWPTEKKIQEPKKCCQPSKLSKLSKTGGEVIEVDSDEMLEKYINSGQTVVVDHTATWCRPCQGIAPYYKKLAAKHDHCVFSKLDVDEFEGTYGVRTLPTFQVYRDGQLLEEMMGADKGKLDALTDKHCCCSSR